jgi:hypothetical protein
MAVYTYPFEPDGHSTTAAITLIGCLSACFEVTYIVVIKAVA